MCIWHQSRGGADIVSCFLLGNPTGAVHRGELQVPGLGMSVEVFGDDGSPLPVGATGELVCTRSVLSMPLGFWNDSDGRKCRAIYFERFPGVWHYGGLCERRPSGGFRIWGRSDAVLNPGGVRIDAAEIYNAVEALPEIAEAVAFGFQRGGRRTRGEARARRRADHELGRSSKPGCVGNVPWHGGPTVGHVVTLPSWLGDSGGSADRGISELFPAYSSVQTGSSLNREAITVKLSKQQS